MITSICAFPLLLFLPPCLCACERSRSLPERRRCVNRRRTNRASDPRDEPRRKEKHIVSSAGEEARGNEGRQKGVECLFVRVLSSLRSPRLVFGRSASDEERWRWRVQRQAGANRPAGRTTISTTNPRQTDARPPTRRQTRAKHDNREAPVVPSVGVGAARSYGAVWDWAGLCSAAPSVLRPRASGATPSPRAGMVLTFPFSLPVSLVLPSVFLPA